MAAPAPQEEAAVIPKYGDGKCQRPNVILLWYVPTAYHLCSMSVPQLNLHAICVCDIRSSLASTAHQVLQYPSSWIRPTHSRSFMHPPHSDRGPEKDVGYDGGIEVQIGTTGWSTGRKQGSQEQTVQLFQWCGHSISMPSIEPQDDGLWCQCQCVESIPRCSSLMEVCLPFSKSGFIEWYKLSPTPLCTDDKLTYVGNDEDIQYLAVKWISDIIHRLFDEWMLVAVVQDSENIEKTFETCKIKEEWSACRWLIGALCCIIFL